MMQAALVRLTWITLLFVSTSYSADAIDWQHWELGAFEAARADNKIILVNVGMEGCAACAELHSDPRRPDRET
jgi:hypothetical protein